MPDPAHAISTSLTIDHILHELRRALSRPIYRIHKGEIGPLHDYAVAHGWLKPAAAQPALIALTDQGLRLLAEDQCRHGLR